MDNESLRSDEMEALSAIYGDEWELEDLNVYSITLRSKEDKNVEKNIRIQFRFPDTYPLNSPPIYTISAPWMSRNEKRRLFDAFDTIYEQHSGESIVYLCIEKAREFLSAEQFDEEKENEEEQVSEEQLQKSFGELLVSHNKHHCQTQEITFFHGHPIIDRRSSFQAHLAVVTCVEHVKQAKATLWANKKVAAATHNISAYRISGGPHNTCFQDCDDDGEAHAGPQLLQLLEMLDVKDVLVVVSRWFGGILLGADRFKHIKNAARELLADCGYLDKNCESKESGKKKKGK
ncbi:protein IMPACT-like protein [Leptotrombidium deliense]|uniref:Protein IMPACT-like protein n=1 Tax=Leptotrombidium deliense TaxID=299467 RepID=A0A443SU74_9ACAR|nr:protein IMPACT-like protein [Leptotrombidium deliense]